MSSPEEHPAAKKFKKGIVVSSYLLADGQPEEFIEIADLQFEFGEEKSSYLCHSSLLLRSSKVFCEMFVSTPEAGWANGVAKMFDGHQKKTVQLVLAMIHGSRDVRAMLKGMGFDRTLSLDELEDLLRLAHKLDAPKLMNACEKYIVSQKSVINADFCNTLRIICLASTFELKDLKRNFMDAALEAIFTSSDTLFTPQTSGLEGGQALMNVEDSYKLFTAVAKAMKDSKKDNIEGNRHYNTCYFKPGDADYRRRLLNL